MKDTAITIITLFTIIGLCLILGIIMKAFNKNENQSSQSNDEYMMDTLGNGLGILMLIFGFGAPILGLLLWIFG